MPSGRIDHQGHSDMEFGALKAEKGWKGTGNERRKTDVQRQGKRVQGQRNVYVQRKRKRS